MKMSNNRIKMPTKYLDMTSAESEYDAGFNWKKFGIVSLTLVGACVLGALSGLATAEQYRVFSALSAHRNECTATLLGCVTGEGIYEVK